MIEFDDLHVDAVEEFTETLKASFIGSDKPADERFAPRLVVNDKAAATNVLSMIHAELAECISFDFSVAFITTSGVQVLIEILNTLNRRKIPGRILTSTYLNFNDPDALRKLLEYPNIETRIYQGDLHAKGYFFNRDGLSTFIIGSSNLTQTALTCNKEWNVLFRSYEGGEMLHSAKSEFDKLWLDESTVDLDSDWIDGYERHLESIASRQISRKDLRSYVEGTKTVARNEAETHITPNKMQELALESLNILHKRHESRALLISATGTGKTYLSAFEIKRQKPRRILFIAHRERILDASLESYQRILGNEYSYGFYGGGSSIPEETCVFAMVSTLTKHLEEFDPRDFDYIIIDEAHRTGAKSYRNIINYFKPDFFLGMTATPERTDGYDIYELFNHVIAYRITLQDALNNNMLAPFHYFGIADLSINESEMDDVSYVSKLTSDERARHIKDKIEQYTVDKHMRRGLIFCSKNEEAKELSKKLNIQGYRTTAISGASPQAERDSAIAQLESGKLDYILSVDILNEGVDIPSLNQIIMLRKTQSPVVFVQQLGRGLRKCDGKEYTLVLDFIGNYQQNYLIPIALSGDQSYSKDNLRRVVKEGSTVIPGSSTISFDRISERRIFKALEESNFAEVKLLRKEYLHLKQVLGRIPKLMDFDENEAIDPLNIIRRFKSYTAFLQKYEKDLPYTFGQHGLKLLAYVSKLASGKRGSDLSVLEALLSGREPLIDADEREYRNRWAASEIRSVKRYLDGAYYPNDGIHLANLRDGRFILSHDFERALDDPYFRQQIKDIVEFGLHRYKTRYAHTYKDTDFVLYEKYTRDDVCRLLRWEKKPNFQNIGGYHYDKETNTFPVFINYQKDPGISITTQYEDRFESENRLIAISKSNRTIASPEIQMLQNASNNGVRCFLFVRKNKNDKNQSTEFYFLGEIHPTGEFIPIIMGDGHTRAVEILYDLDSPVRPDIYDYLTSSFNEV